MLENCGPGSPGSKALQKRRPNCSIADGTHGARGRGAAPQLPCPTTPGRATSPDPAFLTERHRSPGYVEQCPDGSCRRPGTRAEQGLAASCAASLSYSAGPAGPAGPAAPFLTGDPGQRGPQDQGPGRLGPRGRWPRALPTCLPLRRCPMSRLACHPPPASQALSPRRPHSEPRATRTAPPPAGLAAGIANRKAQPTTWRHWRRCL